MSGRGKFSRGPGAGQGFGRRGDGMGRGMGRGFGGESRPGWSGGGTGFGERHLPYRARDGMIMGVCKGLARYWSTSVFTVRAIAVLLLLFTGLWPMIGFYLLAGFLMKPEPVIAPVDEAEAEFYDAYTGSRGQALARLKRKFESIDRRIRRMEDRVTSKDFLWERRMNDDA